MSDSRPGPDGRATAHVALVRDGRVLVTVDGGRRVLTTVADGWPSVARLREAVGDAEAVPVVPARSVRRSPQHVVHVLAARADEGSYDAEEGLRGDWLAGEELDALDDPAEVVAALRLGLDELAGRARRPAARPDWYRTGWLAEADAWVDAQLERSGRRRTAASEVLKMWSLSAVLRTPWVATDGSTGSVYLKATCEWFRAEPALTRAVASFAPESLPGLVAVDEDSAWMLMDPLPGTGADADELGTIAAAQAMARLQLASLRHLPALRAARCPDRTLEPTLASLRDVMDASVELPLLTPEQRARLPELHGRLEEHLHALWACGLPASLIHGDLHPGNVASGPDARGAERLVIYDWTDACLSHPMLDAAHLARSHQRGGGGARDAVVEAFAGPWRAGFGGAEVDRALELAFLADEVFQLISYEGIYRSQEPDARWELGGAVAGPLASLLG